MVYPSLSFDLTGPEEQFYPPETLSDLAAVSIERELKHLTREDAQELIVKLIHRVESIA